MKGAQYLLERQSDDGSWCGPTDMCAPRPFAVDYPLQTHALAALGVLAIHRKLHASKLPERRSGRRRGGYLPEVSGA